MDAGMKLMSVSINTAVSPKKSGYTMFEMYQELGSNGKYNEPLYNWIDLDTWDEVVTRIASNPIGSPLVKN